MAYQVPKCDCGNNLMYMFDKLYHEEFKITKNGVPFKHRYDFCDILEDAWREKLGVHLAIMVMKWSMTS